MIVGGKIAATANVCGDEQVVAGKCDQCADRESQGGRHATPARFSLHALRRAARRNVVPDAVDYVLTYGRVLHRTGITFHVLAARDVPAEDRRAAWAARLVGTVVLVGSDGEIITVYRNRRALPAIRRKVKYCIALDSEKSTDDTASWEMDNQSLTA